MPNIAILMASYTQAQENALEVRKYSETLSIKALVLSLINNFLRQDFDVVGGEALRAVIHLVILEVSHIGFRICLGIMIAHDSKIVVLGIRGWFVGSYERSPTND